MILRTYIFISPRTKIREDDWIRAVTWWPYMRLCTVSKSHVRQSHFDAARLEIKDGGQRPRCYGFFLQILSMMNYDEDFQILLHCNINLNVLRLTIWIKTTDMITILRYFCSDRKHRQRPPWCYVDIAVTSNNRMRTSLRHIFPPKVLPDLCQQ